MIFAPKIGTDGCAEQAQRPLPPGVWGLLSSPQKLWDKWCKILHLISLLKLNFKKNNERKFI
jgi:hypothetical protein